MKSLVRTGRIVISMEDAYIFEGVLGGYVTSGRKQGMNAAALILAHEHGKSIADLPPILKSPNALILMTGVCRNTVSICPITFAPRPFY